WLHPGRSAPVPARAVVERGVPAALAGVRHSGPDVVPDGTRVGRRPDRAAAPAWRAALPVGDLRRALWLRPGLARPRGCARPVVLRRSAAGHACLGEAPTDGGAGGEADQPATHAGARRPRPGRPRPGRALGRAG